jgi:hypothetical protein
VSKKSEETHPSKHISGTSAALLAQVLGTDFLAYVTATTHDVIGNRLTGENTRSLSETQETILEFLRNDIAPLASIENQYALHVHLVDTFTRQGENGSTLANTLRTTAGGKIWEPNSSDPLEYVLLIQLRDMYPALLLPDRKIGFSSPTPNLGTSLLQDARTKEVQKAALAHPTISKIFPENSEHGGRTGNLYTNAGWGGSVQLSMLAYDLIGASWELAHLSTATPSIEEYAKALRRVLATIVAAADRKPASIPVRVGLTGAVLHEDVEEIDLGWARIRSADDRDESVTLDEAIPGTLHAAEAGQDVAIRYRGDIVVEMDIPYRIQMGKIDIGTDWPEGFNPNRIIEQRIENLRLGLALSNDLEPRATVLQAWIRIFNPLHTGVVGWRNPALMRNMYPRKLSQDEVSEWRKWATMISEGRNKSVDVSIRRALLAISDRNAPEDMLVDAVIVWENLFGAKQETTMRVTSSLAWLLGESTQDRQAKQRTYKAIYELRSGIVHGSRELRSAAELTKPAESLEIALQALRVVFRDRPDLLELHDSALRSNNLLLGG